MDEAGIGTEFAPAKAATVPSALTKLPAVMRTLRVALGTRRG